MKKNALLFALALLTNLCFSPLFSQKTVHWKGGAAGREADWFCPKNWSGGTVPNEFSDVVIADVSSGSRVYPVVGSGVSQINSLRLDGMATLQVASRGRLVVLGDCILVDKKSIRVEGFFRVFGEANGAEQSEMAAGY